MSRFEQHREVTRRQHLALRLERLSLLVDAHMRPQQGSTDALQANRDARAELLSIDPDVPSLALVDAFGLSAFELDVLELAAGMQLDYRLRALVTAAMPTVLDEGLTIGSVVALLAGSVETRIDLAGELRSSRLWDAGLLRRPTREGAAAQVIATRRGVAALLGTGPLEHLPPWAHWATEVHRGAFEIDPARTAASVEHGGLVILSGPSGVGKSTLALAIAACWGTRTLAIDVPACADAIGSASAVVADIVELVEDAGLSGVSLVLDPVRRLLFGAPRCEQIADACQRAGVRAIICADALDDLPVHLTDRALLRIPMRGARGPLAAAIFKTYTASESPMWGADETQLRPRQIRHAAALSRALSIPADVALQATQSDSSDLLEATRSQLGLDDIEVTPEVRADLLEFIGAIKGRTTVLEEWGVGRRISRGRGVSALFDGEPGTGKTMAAEVVAHEVGLPLKRVIIASLVDKYIGETEKNLQRLFLEARNSSYILLFDEADSLFGARTDVKGSNDRYANLEINVLLQLMEEHGGIVILTTNLKRNIDQAFLRRLGYKVHFELPERDLRARIWRGMLPPTECETSVDVDKLAVAFPLSGGDIKSAVLRAAYRAASARRKITMADVVECAELECQAQGRVVTFGRL
ncbi:MAG: AAA family ATPase [Deltaproteobacteria bacterium]|nr:AAA family ATPase [Deltaproteobacteria bacterium]